MAGWTIPCAAAKPAGPYTLKGAGTETWFPKFFYRGARYLRVDCLPPKGKTNLPVVKSIAGVVIQSASAPVGEFQCSDDLFNRIHALVRWAQRGNMMSLMTDCPQREKRGWLEEDHLNGPALRYEFDLAQLFTKQMNDMADSQLANGLVPTTAPEYTVFRDRGQTNGNDAFGDSPEWGGAFILVPWQQYEFDGDLELFRRHYDAMTNYIAFLGSRASNHIINYGLGDWYDLGPKAPGVAQLTPIALTATAFYFQDAQIMAQAAAWLGKTNDAHAFSDLAGEIRAAFNDRILPPGQPQLRHRLAVREFHSARDGPLRPGQPRRRLGRRGRRCPRARQRAHGRRRGLPLPAPRARRRRALGRDLRPESSSRKSPATAFN